MSKTAARPGPLAVFDLGKTNSKLFIFAPDGRILDERRANPSWIAFEGKRVLDDAALFDWMRRELACTVEAHGVTSLIVSGHGCTFALVRDNTLAHPVLDYEQEIPQDIATRFDRLIPAFSETYTPRLPLGLNFARHIYWLQAEDATYLAKADAILCYPQFWGWRFCGVKANEYSYVGCHTHLWAPLRRDYSSLVDHLGWRAKMPPFIPAGGVIGETFVKLSDGSSRSVAVHNGVHDSNAALAYYRKMGLRDFTLVSTGTWVIVINLACPLVALDERRDMLVNVTVDGDLAPSLRFMGGREFDEISNHWNGPIAQAAIERVIARGLYAVPSWAAGGPFPQKQGEIVGGDAAGEERAAVAALYVTMMTDLSLDLIQSANKIVIDGGLTKVELFGPMLAQLRPQQRIWRSSMAEGSASGAAALAFEAMGIKPFKDETVVFQASGIKGLETYRETWRRMAGKPRATAHGGEGGTA